MLTPPTRMAVSTAARLVLDLYDDAGPAGTVKKNAQKIIANKKIVAVIGHGSGTSTKLAAPLYAKAKIPLISIHPRTTTNEANNDWLFFTNFSAEQEARFLANYIRNVLIKRNASIVFAQGPGANQTVTQIKKVYQRFGVPIRHEWGFDARSDNIKERLTEIADEMKANADTGAVFIFADPGNTARMIAAMRAKALRNVIAGPSSLAAAGLAGAMPPGSKEALLDKLYTTSPLLFDTAGEKVQSFVDQFRKKNGHQPDWVGAYTYDALALVGQAFQQQTASEGEQHCCSPGHTARSPESA